MLQAVTFLELPRSGFHGARDAFRVRDVNLLLQAFELVAVATEKVLEEANPGTVPWHTSQSEIRKLAIFNGSPLTWIKRGAGAGCASTSSGSGPRPVQAR